MPAQAPQPQVQMPQHRPRRGRQNNPFGNNEANENNLNNENAQPIYRQAPPPPNG